MSDGENDSSTDSVDFSSPIKFRAKKGDGSNEDEFNASLMKQKRHKSK